MKKHLHAARQIAKIEIGHPKHIEELKTSNDTNERNRVARFGSDTDRTDLLNDSEPVVRRSIARNGNSDHHRALMNDPNVSVRESVASNVDHFSILDHMAKNDPDPSVRSIAEERIYNDFGDY
jgi:hypothetical protein